MYVIRYTSIEPVSNFGSSLDATPSYYRSFNYKRTFRTSDLDRAFEQLDRHTARRCYGARAVVRLVWSIDNGKPILLLERDDRDREYRP